MGVLTKAIEGKWGFSLPDYAMPGWKPTPENPHPTYSTQALTLLIILIIGAAFFGMSATIRELVDERDIFLREKGLYLGWLLARELRDRKSVV